MSNEEQKEPISQSHLGSPWNRRGAAGDLGITAHFSNLGKRLFVGEFQMEVLKAVSVMGRQAYGTQIRNHLEKKAGREISTPQVFAALARLTDLGLISAATDETATAGRRGRPRRVYSLETSGLRMLQAGNILYGPMSQGEPLDVGATSMAGSSYTP